MADITINEALVLQKAVRERLNELRLLRNTVANRESFLYAREEKKVVEPQYDVKAVDRKMVELQLFLLKSDSRFRRGQTIEPYPIGLVVGRDSSTLLKRAKPPTHRHGKRETINLLLSANRLCDMVHGCGLSSLNYSIPVRVDTKEINDGNLHLY